jgi:serine/threonine protein kinase
MAPEQVRRDATLGPPADIWAFGVVAFECLTGRLPFEGKTLIEVFTRIQTGPPTPARDFRPELPAEIDEWFSMVFAPLPAARFAKALVAARALAVSLESRRWEKDMSATPLPVTGSGPIAVADRVESEDEVPASTTLGGTARLLSRARKTLDTHEPVSAPVRGASSVESVIVAKSLRPPPPAAAPAPKPEAGVSRRWLVAGAFAGLAIVAGMAMMRMEHQRDGGARAALGAASAPPAIAPGPAHDDASPDGGDGGHASGAR